MRKSVTVQVRMEECLIVKLREVCEASGVTASHVLISGIMRFIKKNSPECMVALRKALRRAKKLNLKRGRKRQRRGHERTRLDSGQEG